MPAAPALHESEGGEMKSVRISLRVLVLALVLLAAWPGPGFPKGEEVSEYGNPFTWVTIGQVKIKAEVVKNKEKLDLGLSYRKELPEGRGMLFFIPAFKVQTFWMKGMQFPLDIVWLVPGKIVGIEKNVSPQFPGIVASPAPVNYVLELPGGFCDKYGIKAGDAISWE
jgi:uncharacterized membrane protein (UPF0127 family)